MSITHPVTGAVDTWLTLGFERHVGIGCVLPYTLPYVYVRLDPV